MLQRAAADTTSTSAPSSSARASSRCTRSRSEPDGSNSTRKSMSLHGVASPRETEPVTAIERPRRRRTRSRISVQFRSTIELRSRPAAMATPYDPGSTHSRSTPTSSPAVDICSDTHRRGARRAPALLRVTLLGRCEPMRTTPPALGRILRAVDRLDLVASDASRIRDPHG